VFLRFPQKMVYIRRQHDNQLTCNNHRFTDEKRPQQQLHHIHHPHHHSSNYTLSIIIIITTAATTPYPSSPSSPQQQLHRIHHCPELVVGYFCGSNLVGRVGLKIFQKMNAPRGEWLATTLPGRVHFQFLNADQ
jgi:hypothetical protein